MVGQRAAADFVKDLQGVDAATREIKRKITAAVQATGTSLIEVFEVGPVIAAVRDLPLPRPGSLRRLQRHGTDRGVLRQAKDLPASRRGNRRLNHAIHIAAVSQASHRRSDRRAYFDKKLAEGKTGKQAPRSLKR